MKYAIVCLMFVCSSLYGQHIKAKVIKVIDGDTFWVQLVKDKTNIKVRLQNADAFETSRREGLYRQAYQADITLDSALALGNAGKKFAKEVLLFETVELVEEPKDKGKDTYGTRDLYLVKINHQDFGVLLEQAGLAAPWMFKKYRWQHDTTATK